MGKIKINLASGANSEKPLINAFLENNNSYVILDNEINGSMGLPIILVSKLEDNKLVKIIDQSEWQLVKEYLKNIIAGNKLEFIKINNEIPADDIYYTQLTLPVPSFDALKNAYPFKDEETVSIVNPIENAMNNEIESSSIETNTKENAVFNPQESSSNEIPIQSEPVAQVGIMDAPINVVSEITPVENNVENSAETAVQNVELANSSEPIVNINTPLVDINIPSENATPSISADPIVKVELEKTPEVSQNIEMSTVIPSEQIVEQPIVNLDNPLLNNLNTPVENDISSVENNTKEPEITPTPIIDTQLTNTTSTSVVGENMFKEQKEAFMQACENMFDALVKKFEKESENHK